MLSEEHGLHEVFCLAMVVLDFIAHHQPVRALDDDAYVLEVKRQLTWVMRQVVALTSLPRSLARLVLVVVVELTGGGVGGCRCRCRRARRRRGSSGSRCAWRSSAGSRSSA